jgi:hypothetical protein
MTPAGVPFSLAVVPVGNNFSLFSNIVWFCTGIVPLLAYLMFLGVLIWRRERTPLQRLGAACRIVSFRFLLEAVVWLVGLVVFTQLSLCFLRAADFGFLLVPFFLTLYAMRAFAWRIVGGKGLPALGKFLRVEGVGLQGRALRVWVVMGMVLSVSSDILLLLGTGLGHDFVRTWCAPYA